MLSRYPLPMLTPSEVREKVAALSKEELVQVAGRLVSEKVEKILEDAVVAAVARRKSQISLVLKAKDCVDPDEDIRDFLKISGYADVNVTSDFPGYNESYEGTTTIKFSVP